jgi:hypothetical protein
MMADCLFEPDAFLSASGWGVNRPFTILAFDSEDDEATGVRNEVRLSRSLLPDDALFATGVSPNARRRGAGVSSTVRFDDPGAGESSASPRPSFDTLVFFSDDPGEFIAPV